MNDKFLNLKSERREAIINAALKEFATKGYLDASTNTIAKEAGISKPLLFHYTSTKKDLFLYLCEYSFRILKPELIEYLESIKKERDVFIRIDQALQLKMKLTHKYQYLYEFYVMTFFTEAEEVKDELASKVDDVYFTSLEKLNENIDKSKFKDNVNVEKAIKVITWVSEGFANEANKELKTDEGYSNRNDVGKYRQELDGYLSLLKDCFYK
ncbi:TetR/AcrR family transcriptional regulator [Evansella halocellulosilytica]|uniref:TetR/AcrR family transcriptional regulator n=1 Tax=Evansella halocellulosilytica TaxID=2011013 RepID=UPI000BB6C91B|nr:TetR/AcrR family transcriptional regulator [Evansella halocellulosilytica]